MVTLDSFRNFANVSSYLHLKSFAWKRDCPISSKLQTSRGSPRSILQSSYRVLQVKSKWKTLKQPAYFLRAIEFWPTFDIQIDITLTMFWKSCKTKLFRNPTEIAQNTPKKTFISIDPSITK